MHTLCLSTVTVLSCVRVASSSSAPSEPVKCLWGPHPHLHTVCASAHRSHGVPPYLLPRRSRVCIVCGVTLYACPAHIIVTHVLHTPHGHPHVQPTPLYGCYRPCGFCVTMPAWAFIHGVCCGGFVQAHAALTYMRPSPYARPRI
jgi:hypothetical protein